MDAYNANPTSMDAALDNFKTFDATLKGVILGDMLELGETSLEEHQKIADKLETINLAMVLLKGPRFSKCQISPKFLAFDNSAQINNYLESIKPEGFLFLIKGSRGMKLEEVIGKL